MTIDPLNVWKSTLATLPKVVDGSWALNFANWYAERIIGIMPDPTVLTPVGFIFTFSAPTFATNLITMTPSMNPLQGITGFANAWASAIALTVFPATLTLMPGTVFGSPPTPATTYSAITSVTLNPASLAAAQAKLMELAAAVPVSNPQDSIFPEKFRDATLLLKIDVTGLNSITPTPAPLPAVGVPLV